MALPVWVDKINVMPLRTLCLMVLLLTNVQIFAGQGDAVTGIWVTPENKSNIEIFPCGNYYCGKIVWLQEPNYTPADEGRPLGQAKLDDNNPDKSLRSRPILGLQLMHNFKYAGEQLWHEGEIYDPESGNTYSCEMRLQKKGGQLDVRGYIGFSFIGRTSVWTRK